MAYERSQPEIPYSYHAYTRLAGPARPGLAGGRGPTPGGLFCAGDEPAPASFCGFSLARRPVPAGGGAGPGSLRCGIQGLAPSRRARLCHQANQHGERAPGLLLHFALSVRCWLPLHRGTYGATQQSGGKGVQQWHSVGRQAACERGVAGLAGCLLCRGGYLRRSARRHRTR
jgi:hypothetical protein